MWFFFQPGVTIRSSKGQIVYQSIRKGIFWSNDFWWAGFFYAVSIILHISINKQQNNYTDVTGI